MISGRMTIGVISDGGVGATLAAGLVRAGHSLIGFHARGEAGERLEAMFAPTADIGLERVVSDAQLLILDAHDELEELVADLSTTFIQGQIVLHTRADLGVAVLAQASKVGALAIALAPIIESRGMSLDLARLPGAPALLTSAPMFHPIGLALAAEVGCEAIIVNESDRAAVAGVFAGLRAGVAREISHARQALEGTGLGSGVLRRVLDETADFLLATAPIVSTNPLEEL